MARAARLRRRRGRAGLERLYDDLAAKAAAQEAEARAARVPDTRPSLPLERYAGTYRSPVYGDVAIASGEDGDGGLRLEAGPRLSARLEHWHFDTFLARYDRRWQGEEPVTFVLDASGAVATLVWSGLEYARVVEEAER